MTGSVSEAESWPSDTDDALLRIGVIESGDTRLNPLQKLTAPEWLTQVDALVGESGGGVGSILCFNLVPDVSWIGHSRTNPNASIFKETNHAAPDKDGNFKIMIEFDTRVKSPGLWLLANGDDSRSTFQVQIDSITVTE